MPKEDYTESHELVYNGEFEVNRDFPTLDDKGEAVAASVTITNTEPTIPTSRTKVVGEGHDFDLYVTGYAKEFPAQITNEEAWEAESEEIGVRRVLQYAQLICK